MFLSLQPPPSLSRCLSLLGGNSNIFTWWLSQKPSPGTLNRIWRWASAWRIKFGTRLPITALVIWFHTWFRSVRVCSKLNDSLVLFYYLFYNEWENLWMFNMPLHTPGTVTELKLQYIWQRWSSQTGLKGVYHLLEKTDSSALFYVSKNRNVSLFQHVLYFAQRARGRRTLRWMPFYLLCMSSASFCCTFPKVWQASSFLGCWKRWGGWERGHQSGLRSVHVWVSQLICCHVTRKNIFIFPVPF